MMTRMFHDIRLPLLGFGAMRLPLLADGSGRVDEAETRKMVAYAMQNGLNYFDTAYPYHGGRIRAHHGPHPGGLSPRELSAGHEVSQPCGRRRAQPRLHL